MSKKQSNFINRLLALLLDWFAKKSVTFNYGQKRRFAYLITKFIMPFKFSRREYVKQIMKDRLGINSEEAEKLRNACYETFVLNSFEMAKIRYISDEEILNRLNIEGLDNLDKAIKSGNGKGAIIISGHFGLWEYIPQFLTLIGYKMTTVVRRQSNQYVDQWFEDMRKCHGANTTDSGMGLREILRALKNGYLLGLLMDQDNGTKGIFTKFLGEWCSAPVGPALISLKTKVPIIPMYVFPNYEGKHLLKIFPAFYPENYENTVEGQQKLTSDYTQLHERIVREHPEQWFWLHRRWKTQPKDCSNNPWVKLIS